MNSQAAALILLVFMKAIGAFADPPPEKLDREYFRYYIIKNLVHDFDKDFKDMGMRVHSCQVSRGGKTLSFSSLGNCLFVVIGNSFNDKEKPEAKLWLLNEKGEYLNPLQIYWRNTHDGWLSFLYEFIYLVNESYLKHITESENSKLPCQIAEDHFLAKDVGNFIGELRIQAIYPWKLSEYFATMKKISRVGIPDISEVALSTMSPGNINKARTYDLKLQTRNLINKDIQDEVFVLKVKTNINLIEYLKFLGEKESQPEKKFSPQRRSCLSGEINYKSNSSGGLP